MKKRLLCLVLAGCMLLSSAVPALADNKAVSEVIEVETEDLAEQEAAEQTEPEQEEAGQAEPEQEVEQAEPEQEEAGQAEPEQEAEQAEPEQEETEQPEAVVEEDPTAETDLQEPLKAVQDTIESVGIQTDALDAAAVKPYTIKYQAHVQNIGWMNSVSSQKYGTFAGTTGKNLWMESLKIDPNGLKGITYRAHVAELGWMDSVSADNSRAFAGTTGRSLAMEAIQINLTGANAQKYDIYYRAHVTNFGWMGWAKNGESAGSAGFAYTLQAVEIKVLPKGQTPEGYKASNPAFREQLRAFQTAKVQNIGWMNKCEVGNIAGTTGRDLYMETIKLETNGAQGIGISYSVHVSNIGWMKEVKNGAAAGTEGRGLPIEAIKIKLTGTNAKLYDIYYQAHVTNIGWMDWAKNGEAAGSAGLAFTLQAIRIAIVSKGAAAPGNTGFAFATNGTLTAQGYSRTKGWLNKVGSGAVIGTTGQALSLDGLKLNLSGIENTGIKYSAHVSNVGWQDYVTNGAAAGIPGKQQIEAVKIQLTGTGSKYYNVWYRVHAANIGWLDWASNGAVAGTSKLCYAAEAIQVVVLPKGCAAPGATAKPYIENREGWVYINGYRRYRDKMGNILDNVAHLFNPSNKQITVDCKRGITTIYGYNEKTGSYDTPIRAFWCSVGRTGSDQTPSGTYRIYRKYSAKVMNASDGSYSVWAPYISCFNGAIYFHGVASINNSSNLISQANFEALGTPRSSGCVRLAGIEAKWLYENCPIGTKVIVGGYNQEMGCPITSPTRYAWVGGSIAPDPTL